MKNTNIQNIVQQFNLEVVALLKDLPEFLEIKNFEIKEYKGLEQDVIRYELSLPDGSSVAVTYQRPHLTKVPE